MRSQDVSTQKIGTIALSLSMFLSEAYCQDSHQQEKAQPPAVSDAVGLPAVEQLISDLNADFYAVRVEAERALIAKNRWSSQEIRKVIEASLFGPPETKERAAKVVYEMAGKEASLLFREVILDKLSRDPESRFNSAAFITVSQKMLDEYLADRFSAAEEKMFLDFAAFSKKHHKLLTDLLRKEVLESPDANIAERNVLIAYQLVDKLHNSTHQFTAYLNRLKNSGIVVEFPEGNFICHDSVEKFLKLYANVIATEDREIASYLDAILEQFINYSERLHDNQTSPEDISILIGQRADNCEDMFGLFINCDKITGTRSALHNFKELTLRFSGMTGMPPEEVEQDILSGIGALQEEDFETTRAKISIIRKLGMHLTAEDFMSYEIVRELVNEIHDAYLRGSDNSAVAPFKTLAVCEEAYLKGLSLDEYYAAMVLTLFRELDSEDSDYSLKLSKAKALLDVIIAAQRVSTDLNTEVFPSELLNNYIFDPDENLFSTLRNYAVVCQLVSKLSLMPEEEAAQDFLKLAAQVSLQDNGNEKLINLQGFLKDVLSRDSIASKNQTHQLLVEFIESYRL